MGAILSRPLKIWRLLALCALVAAGPASAARDDIAAERERRQSELARVSGEITVSRERMEALIGEIAALRKDEASITAALIQAAKTEKKLSEDIEDIAARLADLGVERDALRASLASRREVLGEVLGALQRMGLNPPPALLVTPEDALSSVRSAILLGAAVPEMRAETLALAAQMERLGRLLASIEAERGRLAETVAAQAEEKKRLELLQAEKRQLQDRSEAALAEERKRAAALAEQAGSLTKLIAALEAEAEKRRQAAEAERLRQEQEREAAARAVPEGNRLIGSVPFESLRGRLTLPVVGYRSRAFGAGDGAGGRLQGDTVTTQSGAIVTAPADGSVLYAGPFRSYGQLLILNAGDGYHIVLAGMGRISVGLGQSVLAGEPVGAMGETRVASTVAFANENAGPELYIEFRKDGKPVDPSPWWAERLSGRTENGT